MPEHGFRNFDDGQSDPDVVAARHRIGRSIYFEVSLTLAELADKERIVRESLALESNPLFINNGNFQYNPDFQDLEDPRFCPHSDDYIWIGSCESAIRAIKAKSLVHLGASNYQLYNPITGNFNQCLHATIIKDQKFVTAKSNNKKVVARFGLNHKLIRNTADRNGIHLYDYVRGSDMLIARREKGKNKVNFNIYNDFLNDILYESNLADLVEITLETEFIYGSGITQDEVILTHNRKQDEFDFNFA